MTQLSPGDLAVTRVDVGSNHFSSEEIQRFDSAGYGNLLQPGAHPAILVVDMTYEFCGHGAGVSDSPKASGAEAWATVSVISDLLKVARSNQIPVIYSKNMLRRHPAEQGSWALKTTAQASPEELEIVDEISPHSEDLVIEKTKPSAFFSTPLTSYLTSLGVDTLFVTGTTTSGCVRATVVDSFSNNFRTFVVVDAVFDRSRTSHEVNLFELQQKYAGLVYAGALSEWIQQDA